MEHRQKYTSWRPRVVQDFVLKTYKYHCVTLVVDMSYISRANVARQLPGNNNVFGQLHHMFLDHPRGGFASLTGYLECAIRRGGHKSEIQILL
jgi:hypothetical protein